MDERLLVYAFSDFRILPHFVVKWNIPRSETGATVNVEIEDWWCAEVSMVIGALGTVTGSSRFQEQWRSKNVTVQIAKTFVWVMAVLLCLKNSMSSEKQPHFHPQTHTHRDLLWQEVFSSSTRKWMKAELRSLAVFWAIQVKEENFIIFFFSFRKEMWNK